MKNYKQYYVDQFNKMREENLGKSFERRELGILASKHGIYINSTLWCCGLNNLFHTAKVGPKCVYLFKVNPVVIADIEAIFLNAKIYRNNDQRKIERAKALLRRFGINNINLEVKVVIEILKVAIKTLPKCFLIIVAFSILMYIATCLL